MTTSTAREPVGILNPQAGERKFRLSRHAPAPDVGCFVKRYWSVAWDLRGQEPYLQETLPQPCVNLVFGEGGSKIYGVAKGKFSVLLADRGRVFGVKFRPGGFYPFVKSPVSALADEPMSLPDAFGLDGTLLEEAILSQKDEREMIALAEGFLRERLPKRDPNVERVNRIVDRIVADREITKVDDLANWFGLNKRTLQRLFSRYVGASPKWVIRRYRLHEAADRLADGEVADWPKMALDLGYFDQAHFINDFKAMVGVSPAEYAKNAGSGSRFSTQRNSGVRPISRDCSSGERGAATFPARG